jgi:membrane protease YdiL (CAAX protease family)
LAAQGGAAMTSAEGNPVTGDQQAWGRWATLGFAVLALLGSQAAALLALTKWYGVNLIKLPDFSGDGVAVSLVIFVSIPLQLVLLWLLAQSRGGNAAEYLGLKLPSRGELGFGIAVTVAMIVVGNGVSWLIGHDIITPFQVNIYRTAAAAGWLPLLWLAVAVLTPIGEETLFRGFLFRGWLRKRGDAWPVIVITSLLWAIVHVQYDLYIIVQIFVFGMVLGWLRWASGSTILTIVLHAMINCEGMLETIFSLHR